MSSARYTDEFKQEAVRQVIAHGHSVAGVAGRLGTTTHSLYAWIKRFNGPTPQEALDPCRREPLPKGGAEASH